MNSTNLGVHAMLCTWVERESRGRVTPPISGMLNDGEKMCFSEGQIGHGSFSDAHHEGVSR